MGLEKLFRSGRLPPPPPPELSVDQIIAEAQRRAGGPQAPLPDLDHGPLVARGSSIRVMRDLIAVELLPGLGKVGLLFITDRMKDTRNQTFTRAKVVSIGEKALGMNGVMLYEEVLVSEYFGQEVKLIEGDVVWKLRVGRIRDIAGVFRPDGLRPPTNRVLMTRIDPPKMAGDLYLPEDMRAQQFECLVVGVGPDATVKLDDRVLVPKDSSVRILIDGQELLLIDEPALLAIL